MNIDVREYLRINPISVHDLTLSDNDNDCFLLFPTNNVNRGYQALTQNVLFRELQKSIFGGLLTDDGKIKTFDATEADIDGKFNNYVRKSTAQNFKDDFDQRLATLESGLDNIILVLRRKGILDYAGAVELQSNNVRKINWNSSTISSTFYNDMSYATGLIRCITSKNNIGSGGHDEVSIGDEPVFHTHPNTKIEALSGSLAKNFGGGELVGNFTIGSKDVLAQVNQTITAGMQMNPIQGGSSSGITYPLYGQNVIDWRNPSKTHNNVPPCLNIHVRYWNNQPSFSRFARQLSRTANGEPSASESQYMASEVKNLQEYASENLSVSDCVLRLSLVGEEVRMMRQELQTLLDIFSKKTNDGFSDQNQTMEEKMHIHLDGILQKQTDFIRWRTEKMEKLDEIERKLEVLAELVESIPPLNYIGRIIISTTDDTEKKVIAHYGGKRWRRIENFLRGVPDHQDPNNIPGQKFGEEYVALRESNIPLHSHQMKVKTEWTCGYYMEKNGLGSTNAVNDSQGSGTSKNVVSSELRCQISPLEYPPKNWSEVATPHDNMPPYMSVYIWECVELTDYEHQITGEPKDNKCKVFFLGNEGMFRPEGHDPYANWGAEMTIGEQLAGIPGKPIRANYDFIGWKCPDGSIKSHKAVGNDIVYGNSYYIAQWKPKTYTVIFDSNGGGGQPSEMKKTYKHGETIGYLPTIDESTSTFDGWFTAANGGTKIGTEKEVTGNVTYYAHWKGSPTREHTVEFYNGGVRVKQETVDSGTTIRDIPPPTISEDTFTGWYTSEIGGNIVPNSMKVTSDLTLYAHFSEIVHTITWDYNDGTSKNDVWKITHNAEIGTLPAISRQNWKFDGWFTAVDGDTKIIATTKVTADVTYYAHWQVNTYTVTFNANGGRINQEDETETRIVNSGDPIGEFPETNWTGHQFSGWYTSATSGMKVSPSTKVNSNITLYARWDANNYVVTFDSNGGSGNMPPQTFQYGVEEPLDLNGFYAMATIIFDGNGGTSSESSRIFSKTFLGWASSSSGDIEYANGATVHDLGDMTLYAKWGNYGTIGTLPDASRIGHSQTGWWTAVSGGSKITTSTTVTGDATYYAHWIVNQYTATFNANGGTGGTTKTQNYGTALVPPEVTREGYTFSDWSPSVPSTMPAENKTYTAQWEVNQYTVTFNANGGTGGWSRQMDYGAAISEPSVTRTGYTFTGWSPSPDATVPASNVTYTAQWTINQYTVTFKVNDGTPTEITREIDQGHAVGTLPSASRTGYTLDGWFTSESGGTQITAATIPTGNVTYYAHWTPIKYLVTFNANGGTGGTSGLMDYGSTIVAPTVSRMGYSFTGWTPAPVAATVPIGGATYTAQWETNTYSVTYKPGSYGTGSEQTVDKTHDVALTLMGAIFTRPGYTQTGWATSDGGSKAYDLSASYTTNAGITLYPFWTANKHSITYYPNNPS